MPTTLTESASYDDVIVPADGDLAGADSGAQPIKNSFQRAANRDAYISQNLHGVLVSRAELRGEGATVVVAPFRVWASGRLYTKAQTNIALLGLTANVWYYVYAYVSGGVLTIEHVTTAPDPATGYATKSGAGGDTRVYLGCFYTLTTASCRPFRAVDGRYTWARGQGGLSYTNFVVVNAATNTGWTSVAMAAWAPPHAVEWRFNGVYRGATSGPVLIQVRANGDADAAWSIYHHAANVDDRASFPLELTPNANGTQHVEHIVADSGANITLVAAGFQE